MSIERGWSLEMVQIEVANFLRKWCGVEIGPMNRPIKRKRLVRIIKGLKGAEALLGGIGPSDHRRILFRFFYAKVLPELTNKTNLAQQKRGKAKDFYQTNEWRALRYEAFKIHGRACQCCGARPPSVVLHVDHIQPRSKFTELELTLSNLQILCEACNMGKSNKDASDFRTPQNATIN